MIDHVKVIFQLIQDEDGYPPVTAERLWALPLDNGNYIIDSIPFFVLGISSGDEVSAESQNGALQFKALVRPSAASTFRLVPSDVSSIDRIRSDIERLGGRSEYNAQLHLLAFEIPKGVDIDPVLRYLVDGQSDDLLDFEEGALRHSLRDQPAQPG